jgi:hypothetical protein
MTKMKNSNESVATTSTVAKINNVEIVLIENGEKMIAVKPICDAIGIASNGQIEKIKTDPLLSSTYKTVLSVGADGKEREMFAIPFRFVFGWIFRIDSRNVKEEAREAVERYQLECYNALYNHFTSYADFVEQKQSFVEEKLKAYEVAKANFNNANKLMKEVERDLKMARELTFSDYDATRRQLSLFKPEEMEG